MLARPERGLFAVADGMGGHAGGDIASRIAVDILDDRILAASDDPANQLETAIRTAHQAVLKAATADRALTGMGTTLTALWIHRPGHGLIGHVGDSRAYRLRGDRLERLTRDQTWVQRQVDAGLMIEEEARHHPYSAVLTSALGIHETELVIQLIDTELEPGALFLLCSDGLTARLADHELGRIIAAHDDLDQAAAALIDAANQAGGPDNITAILVRIP